MIAIIAILASLILPALSRAKARAHAIQCQQNLKQLTLAWMSYADDSADRLPYCHSCGTHGRPNSPYVWVGGWLDLNIPRKRDNWDIEQDLKKSPLWGPGGSAAGIWRCPGDRSTGINLQGQAVPRVRSFSMNPMLGGPSERSCPGVPWLDFTGFAVYYKRSAVVDPARTFVFLGERAETVSEAVFYLAMDGSPQKNGPPMWYDFPACSHNRAANLSFVDGHAEYKKWLDPRTTPPRLAPVGASYPDGVHSPGNRDLLWLQERCTRKSK